MKIIKLLKNRKFAILVTVVVVIIATLLGVRGSLNRLVRDVETLFAVGVYLDDEGYIQPGIETHLRNRARSALGYATLMVNDPVYTDEAEALLAARHRLLNAASIREKYTANEELQRAFDALIEKERAHHSTGADNEDTEYYASTFQGAQTAIKNSRYNQKALSYMNDASFIAQLLKPILFVRSPQVFS